MKQTFFLLMISLVMTPMLAQEEPSTTPTDSIALKQINVEAIPTSEKKPVLTEQQMAEIQKTTLENQKKAEKAKADALAEAKKVEKEQRKLEKEQRRFEKEQDRISDAEKKVIKTKERINKEKGRLEKMTSKLEKDKRKGKLTDIEIEKENIKISKKVIYIKELQEDLDKTEKKLNKLRG